MKKLVAALGVLVALVVGVPSMSSAGGWVVISLDAAPELRPGEPTDVGFTVLRHGVTPESNDDLVVLLTDERGNAHRFDVIAQGVVGHHTVSIEIPTTGTYRWTVLGEFVDVDLGAFEVAPPGSASSGSDGAATWTWDALQWGSLTFAVAMAGLAGRDVLRNRRRPASTATA